MPLPISAVKDFGGVQSFFHRTTNYRVEAVRLLRVLNAEHVGFRCTCETLLQGIVPKDQMRAFTRYPWRDASESIVTRDSEGFQGELNIMILPFNNLFDLTADALEVLREKMCVGSDYKVTRVTKKPPAFPKREYSSRIIDCASTFWRLSVP